jgi:transcription elongation factor Elf1
MEQNFIIRCPRCRWAEMSTGISEDLTHLSEVVTCTNCGGSRKFRCPRCGQLAKMTRVRGNSSNGSGSI